MTETKWWTYISGLKGHDTAREAAAKAGIYPSSFTRWSKGQAPDPKSVVAVARAYNANVLGALVAAELITEEEALTPYKAPTPEMCQKLSRTFGAMTNDLERYLKRVTDLTQATRKLLEETTQLEDRLRHSDNT